MTLCLVPGCRAEIREGGAFCRACARLIREDEHRGIRLAYHASMFSPAAAVDAELVVRWEEGGLPCFQRFRDSSRISDVLVWLEYDLVLRAVAADICERRVKRLVRLGRKGATSAEDEGGGDDDRGPDVQ